MSRSSRRKPRSPMPNDPRHIAAFRPFISERRWVVWSWKLNDKGKWTKRPRQPDGESARNNDPTPWHTFEDCWALVLAGKANGIGLMLLGLASERMVAIDLDDVFDAEKE